MEPSGFTSGNVIFGYHAVREALQMENTRVEKILLSQGRRDARADELLGMARMRGVPITILSSPLFHKMFGVKGHQSLAAQVATCPYQDADALIRTEAEVPLFLALDEVMDPRNLGSILRSAAAAGVQGVFLPSRRTAPLSATVEKASAGAVNHVRIARVGNLVNLLRTLNERTIQTVGLVPDAPLCYYDCDFRGPTALVLGGEAKGIRRLVRETCSVLVSIPMAQHVESLNVSVAAAVVLYETLRQRRAARLEAQELLMATSSRQGEAGFGRQRPDEAGPGRRRARD
ncbi:MAG: 23S rRNA (guanosine(2251)-2'-O)-methyltransferase RlmB [Acidobacteriota bacterium]